MSTHKVSPRSACATKEGELTLHEKTVAVAEVPAREAVAAVVHVETKANEHFAKAEKERHHADEAARAKAAACADASAAKPASHLMAAVGGIGTKIASTFEGIKGGVAQKKHERSAAAEEEKLVKEDADSREAARREALKAVNERTASDAHGTVVSEYVAGNEVVAYAVVPERKAVLGTGVAETHLEDHVAKAQAERDLAVDAEAQRLIAEEKGGKAHVGCEAKAGISGIGTVIGSRLSEAKHWISEKVHEHKGNSEQSKGESTLKKDIERAGEKAKEIAEAEARRQDDKVTAHVIGEATSTKA